MKEFKPKVAIIIVIYNNYMFFKRALEAALNQTYKNVEIIVVNDGGKYNEKIERLVTENKDKITYYKKGHEGTAAAINFALNKIDSEYFSVMHNNQIFKADKIYKQIECLKKIENKDTIIMSDAELYSYVNKKINDHLLDINKIKNIKYDILLDINTKIYGSTLLISKNKINKIGKFDEKLKVAFFDKIILECISKNEYEIVLESLVQVKLESNSKRKTNVWDGYDELDVLYNEEINKIPFKEWKNNFNRKTGLLFNYFKNLKEEKKYLCGANIGYIYTKILLEQDKKEKVLKFINKYICENKDTVRINDDIIQYSKKSKAKKRIFVFNNEWNKGGIERVLYKVLPNLTEKYDIIFGVNNFSENRGFDLPKEIKKIEVSKKIYGNLPLALVFLTKLFKADLFIGNQNLDMFFIPIYELLSFEKVKTIAVNHYNYFLPFEYNWAFDYAPIRNYYYKFPEIVSWPTTYSTKVYDCNNHNGFYLPNPMGFEPKEFVEKDTYNIVTVARYADGLKRLDLILKSFKLVLDRVPNAVLTIVGPYDYKMVPPGDDAISIGKLLKQLDIPKENLIFAGEQKNVSKYYQNSDLFMFTSETEGFGMVLVEAGAWGLPVVTFDIFGIEDIIKDGINGFLVKMYDIETMADKIAEVLLNRDLKNEISKNAIELSKRFNIEHVMKKWDEMLEIAFSDDEYVNYENLNTTESRIIQEYEKDILKNITYEVEGNLYHKVKFYLQKYGIKATIKKIEEKLYEKKEEKKNQ